MGGRLLAGGIVQVHCLTINDALIDSKPLNTVNESAAADNINTLGSNF